MFFFCGQPCDSGIVSLGTPSADRELYHDIIDTYTQAANWMIKEKLYADYIICLLSPPVSLIGFLAMDLLLCLCLFSLFVLVLGRFPALSVPMTVVIQIGS